MSRPLTWLLVEAGALSHGEPRKSQTQASLPTRSADGTPLDNLIATGWLFSVPVVTLLPLDTRTLSRPRSRPLPLRRLTICASARCHSRLSALGVGTTVPPSRPQVLRLGECHSDAVPILPFPPPFLAGTAGRRYLLRPGGTALLCFPATRDPPGFRSLPKRLAVLPWPHCESFSAPPEKAELGLGSRHHLPYSAREKAGRKRGKNLCIKTAFPSSASSARTHN